MKSSTEAAFELVDVYAYRQPAGGAPEFLLLRRAPDVMYAGQWRMIGGKIKPSETAVAAGRRELEEETGCSPSLFWCVPTINSFFDFKRNKLHHIPVFAAVLPTQASLRLNHEHNEYSWLPAEQAAGQVHWPEQARILRLISQLLHSSQGQLPPEWIVDRHGTTTSS
ncbi:MAG: NUDIX hydrolase [Cyclonatronaceae bacterium]